MGLIQEDAGQSDDERVIQNKVEADEHDDELDDDADIDASTGEFSFGDDELERALASVPKPKSAGVSTVAAKTGKQQADASDEDSESENKHSKKTDHSSVAGSEAARAPGSLSSLPPVSSGLGRSLPSINRKPLPGLSSLARHTAMHEDEDDDMDEVERLLLEQSSMRRNQPAARSAPSALRLGRRNFDDEDDDEPLDVNGEVAAPASPLRDAGLPPTLADDDEFSHFDADDGDDAAPSPAPQSRSSHAPLKTPSASPPRASRQSPQRTRHHDEHDDPDADDYLEESFDLEESLQEEEEDV
ncbi:hypothetical protein PINS_up004864 [Pythium insidiosum]|nr:hypothetical protein PINS_up004864 [Pythium insidiosum]